MLYTYVFYCGISFLIRICFYYLHHLVFFKHFNNIYNIFLINKILLCAKNQSYPHYFQCNKGYIIIYFHFLQNPVESY